MIYTKFVDGNTKSSYIPSDIIVQDMEYATYEDDLIIYCCECMDYDFEIFNDEIFIVLVWGYEGTNVFSFSTYHPLNGDFLELLEKVRAINRFDGKASLLTLFNYDYSIWFKPENKGYVVYKIAPQDYSYQMNIPAFYEPDALTFWLHKYAIEYCKTRNKYQISVEFRHNSPEGEFYLPCISEHDLANEIVRYDSNTDTYGISVDIGRAMTSGEDYLHILWLGVENTYDTRIQYNKHFVDLLKKINALGEDGTVDIEGDALYQMKFEIILRQFGTLYYCIGLHLQSETSDGYWEYLMRLAELEHPTIEQ